MVLFRHYYSRTFCLSLALFLGLTLLPQLTSGAVEPQPPEKSIAPIAPQEPDPHRSKESRNVNYPDQYDGGDFKKPSSFLNNFKNGNLGFLHAFVASLSVIIVSELGDKTFFIAAIMAMRHPRVTVFLGAISALAVMTILSAFLGFATTVIPRMYTHYISTALFAIFGLKMLKEAHGMSPAEGQEEYDEVQKSVNKRETEYDKEVSPGDEESTAGSLMPGSGGSGSGILSRGKSLRRRLLVFFSRIFLESFSMTFLAEWGDRSQLTTIILAAREDAMGVTIGAIFGHSVCTLLAVLGGRIVAQRISVRTVTFIGGIVFLIFAVSALILGPGS